MDNENYNTVWEQIWQEETRKTQRANLNFLKTTHINWELENERNDRMNDKYERINKEEDCDLFENELTMLDVL